MDDDRRVSSVEDLLQWLRDLDDCPPISWAVKAQCRNDVHGDDPSTWFYVEADARAGVGRLRCLACGAVKPLLDSEAHWTFPPVWACRDCRQSIAEVGFGVHADDGLATWMVVGARCVECGRVAGMTDLVVPDVPVDDFVDSL
jgi:hypothetical protein